MKYLKYFSILLLLTFVVIQFIKPDKNNHGYQSVALFEKETVPTKQIAIILKNNCYDCHSDQTNYPWYNNISPINYWLEEHIKDGKKHLNFSKWSSYSLKKKEHKMDELHEEVEEGEMPLNSYTWTHAEANLTPEQVVEIVTWGKKVQADYKQQMITK